MEKKDVKDILGGKKLPIKISMGQEVHSEENGKDGEVCVDTYGSEGVYLDINNDGILHSSVFIKTEDAEQFIDLLARAVTHQKGIAKPEDAIKAAVIDPNEDYRTAIHGWTIDEDGDLVFKPLNYIIEKDRLDKRDWISHMRQKTWCDLNDFIPAYFKACEQAGIKHLNVQLYGWDDGYKFEE